MSMDFQARDDVDAVNNTMQRFTPLIAVPYTPPMTVGSSSVWQPIASGTIPGGTIQGGELLDIFLELNKPITKTGSWSVRFTLGGVALFYNFVQGGCAYLHFQDRFSIGVDRKFGYYWSTAFFGNGNIAGTETFTSQRASQAAIYTGGARTPARFNFVSYDTAANKSVETVLVNFDQPVAWSLDVVGLTDPIELIHFDVAYTRPASLVANSKTILFYGDSITEGTGATSVDKAYPNVFRTQSIGYPANALGLGGQVSSQIADRLVVNKQAKQAKVVLAIGTNDFDAHVGDGPGWWAAIKPQIDRAVAYMGHSNWYWASPNRRPAWAAGDANDTALSYVIAQAVAIYGAAHVLDLSTTVSPANFADSVHPNDAGHTQLATAHTAKRTALGW